MSEEDDLIRMVEESVKDNNINTPKKSKYKTLIIVGLLLLLILIGYYYVGKFTHGGILTINDKNVSIPNSLRLDLMVDTAIHDLTTTPPEPQDITKEEEIIVPKEIKYDAKMIYNDGCEDLMYNNMLITHDCSLSRSMNIPGKVVKK